MLTDLLKEYRLLDDRINVRLNRTNAQFRDRDREGKGKGNVQDDACIYLWKSLVGRLCLRLRVVVCLTPACLENWKRRTEIVSYCVGVVDKSMDEKRQSKQDQASDSSAQRQIQAALYADEVKVHLTGANFDHLNLHDPCSEIRCTMSSRWKRLSVRGR